MFGQWSSSLGAKANPSLALRDNVRGLSILA
jgi:hypothetical protein